MAHGRTIRDAATIDQARASADRTLNRFRREFPAAMACLADDLEALLAIHRVPHRHRITVRTTNLAEHSFLEERRRTKVIPRLNDERFAMKLVFATLIRCVSRLADNHRQVADNLDQIIVALETIEDEEPTDAAS